MSINKIDWHIVCIVWGWICSPLPRDLFPQIFVLTLGLCINMLRLFPGPTLWSYPPTAPPSSLTFSSAVCFIYYLPPSLPWKTQHQTAHRKVRLFIYLLHCSSAESAGILQTSINICWMGDTNNLLLGECSGQEEHNQRWFLLLLFISNQLLNYQHFCLKWL